MKRALLMTPAAIERRERRVFKLMEADERAWERKVLAYMREHGASFDEAYVACGGTIVETVKVPTAGG